MELARIALIKARENIFDEEFSMSDFDKEKLEEELMTWKMRTAISMGVLRKLSSLMPENTEYGDIVRKAIKDIEDLT